MTSKDLVICQCVLCLQTDPGGCQVSSVLRSRHRKFQAIGTTLRLLDQAEELVITAPSLVALDHDHRNPVSSQPPGSDGGKTYDQDWGMMGNLDQHRSTLKNITLAVIRESNSISRPETLCFVGNPSLQQHQDVCWTKIQQELKFHSSAAKFYKYNFLLSESPVNQEFSRSESTLRESLEQIDTLVYMLGSPPTGDRSMVESAQRLRGVAVDALSQLMSWKKDIWIAQGTALMKGEHLPELDVDGNTQDIKTVDTTRFLVTGKGLHYHPLVLSSIVHVVISNLVFGLTHKGCEVLLQGFRDHTQTAVEYSRGELSPKLPEFIPKSLTGAFQCLNLDPSLRQYIVCPQCHCLYPAVHPYPMRCGHRSVPRAPGCQTSLLMQRRINGRLIHTPIKTYLHQDFKQWLARFLCRPAIESIIRLSQSLPARSQCGTVTDILCSEAIRGFLAADKLPFLRPVEGQYRLIFALSVDGFNPLTNRQAKQVRSSTAIYLICLNLPLAVRQLPHNMYLVGVVPGPRKLKEGEINHYLDLVVDDFTPFWNPGVSLRSTALNDHPTRCLAAIIPIICDALGAREVSGFPSINSMQFCIFCPLPLYDIENFDFTKWSKRTCAEHKALAEEWRSADGAARLTMQKASHPARYTSLLRLPYFDPVRFTTIDTMHLLYLGLFQRHCRQIWGMDVKLEDGDGSRRGHGTTPPPPSDEDIEVGRLILVSGRLERFYTCKVKKGVLYQLCEENGLRTGGKKRDLIQELKAFVAQRDSTQTNETDHEPTLPQATQTMKQSLDLRDMPAITEKVKLEFRETESRLAKDMSLKKIPNDPLKLMCYLRGLKFEHPSPVKSAMIDALASWRREQAMIGQWIPRMDVSQLETLAVAQQNLAKKYGETTVSAAIWPTTTESATPNPQSSKPKPKPNHRPKSAVLGSGVLDSYVVDRRNMVLPSWITAPPAKAGHAEHGKMSADQWRVFCTVNLPITLIRIWSVRRSEPRWHQMLLNFLDMVIAVEIASLVVTSPTLIAQYEALMHRYLESLKSVYKDAPIVQNHHIAMHVGDVMRTFGPTPGFRAYATERFNYMLQRVKTNRHELGEIEMTMTRSVSRASNLVGLLENPGAVPESMKETVSRILKGDQRGTRVNDVAVGTPGDMQDLPRHRNPNRKQSRLDDVVLERLTEYLNSDKARSTRFVPYHRRRNQPEDIHLHPDATFIRLLVVEGVSYRPSGNSMGSSQVLVKQDGRSQRPAVIQSIFRHSRHSSEGIIEEKFLAVRFLKSLTQTEQDRDPYRNVNKLYGPDVCPFKDIFGSIWRADLEDIVVVQPSQLICHFAWTAMNVQSISGLCVHAQPLNRLKTQFELNEWLDESDLDIEMYDHDHPGGREKESVLL